MILDYFTSKLSYDPSDPYDKPFIAMDELSQNGEVASWISKRGNSLNLAINLKNYPEQLYKWESLTITAKPDGSYASNPVLVKTYKLTSTGYYDDVSFPVSSAELDALLGVGTELQAEKAILMVEVSAMADRGLAAKSINKIRLQVLNDISQPSEPVKDDIAGVDTLGRIQVQRDSAVKIDENGYANIGLKEGGGIAYDEEGNIFTTGGGTNPIEQEYVSPGSNGDSAMDSAIVRFRPSLLPSGSDTITIKSLMLGLYWMTEYPAAEQIRLRWEVNGDPQTALSTGRTNVGSINGASDIYKYTFNSIAISGEVIIESVLDNPLDGGWTSTTPADDSPIISDKDGSLESIFCGIEYQATPQTSPVYNFSNDFIVEENNVSIDWSRPIKPTGEVELPKQTTLTDTTAGTDLSSTRIANVKQIKEIIANTPVTWNGSTVTGSAVFTKSVGLNSGFNAPAFSTGLGNSYSTGILHVQGECKFTRYYPPTSTSTAPGTSLADIDMPNTKQTREIAASVMGSGTGGGSGEIREISVHTNFASAIDLPAGLWEITMSVKSEDTNANGVKIQQMFNSYYTTLQVGSIYPPLQLVSGQGMYIHDGTQYVAYATEGEGDVGDPFVWASMVYNSSTDKWTSEYPYNLQQVSMTIIVDITNMSPRLIESDNMVFVRAVARKLRNQLS